MKHAARRPNPPLEAGLILLLDERFQGQPLFAKDVSDDAFNAQVE